MPKDELKRIEQLNQAYFAIKEALSIIKENVDFKKDDDTLFWRVEKSIDALQKVILKRLRDNILEEDFQKIIKMFDKEK